MKGRFDLAAAVFYGVNSGLFLSASDKKNSGTSDKKSPDTSDKKSTATS